MTSYTTGQVARAAGVSDKAVRIYADRGLLPMERTDGGDRRLFGPVAVRTAQLIGLLRRLDLSLKDIDGIVGSIDAVAAFDDIWAARRARLHDLVRTGERVRAALSSSTAIDMEVHYRDVPERLTLDLELHATLWQVPHSIAAGTALLFDVLRDQGVELVGHPFVVFHERATALASARVTVRVPIQQTLRPVGSTRVALDPAHREAFVCLEQAESGDQGLLVRVHDHLSTGAFGVDLIPAGDNREIYLPTFGTGSPGYVMEIAVPVDDAPRLRTPVT